MYIYTVIVMPLLLRNRLKVTPFITCNNPPSYINTNNNTDEVTRNIQIFAKKVFSKELRRKCDGNYRRPEAEFLDEIQTKILRVYLLAIYRHLYSFALSYCTQYRRKEIENHTPFSMV
jgi:hypothetical protein